MVGPSSIRGSLHSSPSSNQVFVQSSIPSRPFYADNIAAPQRNHFLGSLLLLGPEPLFIRVFIGRRPTFP